MPGQALAQADLAPLIHSPHVKHALCNVDPEDVHLWFHWTRLLWLYEFTALAPIVAHRSRAAQGAGPFHYDPLDAHGSVTAFRSEIGHEELAGLKTNLPRIHQARTTEAQYRHAVALFEQHPQPAG